ncbi:hypothetical protein [Streptomyces sp. NPDC059008]|uniref:hypothetical protein n=1 Tax=Streptomyces sp. NPDC059008 TaxID=3346693 RepID=UPI0036A8F903
MIRIPHDLHEWDVADVHQWLARLAADPDVSERELAFARQAVARAAATGQSPNAN